MRSAILAAIFSAAVLFAQPKVLDFDPAHTQINFTLSATGHTVHGTFQLLRGHIDYDPAAGTAGGEIVVDARSGATGNSSRDHKMHSAVLESERYPEIVFKPDRVHGAIGSQPEVHGTFHIHGSEHEMTLLIEAEPSGDDLDITTHFKIPYTAWGMKNPSTFILRVAGEVNVEIRATARVSAGGIKTPSGELR